MDSEDESDDQEDTKRHTQEAAAPVNRIIEHLHVQSLGRQSKAKQKLFSELGESCEQKQSQNGQPTLGRVTGDAAH